MAIPDTPPPGASAKLIPDVVEGEVTVIDVPAVRSHPPPGHDMLKRNEVFVPTWRATPDLEPGDDVNLGASLLELFSLPFKPLSNATPSLKLYCAALVAGFSRELHHASVGRGTSSGSQPRMPQLFEFSFERRPVMTISFAFGFFFL